YFHPCRPFLPMFAETLAFHDEQSLPSLFWGGRTALSKPLLPYLHRAHISLILVILDKWIASQVKPFFGEVRLGRNRCPCEVFANDCILLLIGRESPSIEADKANAEKSEKSDYHDKENSGNHPHSVSLKQFSPFAPCVPHTTKRLSYLVENEEANNDANQGDC